MVELENWINRMKNAQDFERADAAYAKATQRIQRNNSAEVISSIRGSIPRSRIHEQLEGQFIFLDNHLSKSPDKMSDHEQDALFYAIHKLTDAFGPVGYRSVYREWKTKQLESLNNHELLSDESKHNNSEIALFLASRR